MAIADALSERAGKTLPWATVQEALEGAFRARLLERTPDSGEWPCNYAEAQYIRLQLPSEAATGIARMTSVQANTLAAEADLSTSQIQDLAEVVGDVVKAAVGYRIKFRLRVELGGDTRPPDEVAGKVNEILQESSEDLLLR